MLLFLRIINIKKILILTPAKWTLVFIYTGSLIQKYIDRRLFTCSRFKVWMKNTCSKFDPNIPGTCTCNRYINVHVGPRFSQWRRDQSICSKFYHKQTPTKDLFLILIHKISTYMGYLSFLKFIVKINLYTSSDPEMNHFPGLSW